MTDHRHAIASDLPNWPCPPRVRDIPNIQESWGYAHASIAYPAVVAQDELGRLWADGDAIPVFLLIDESRHAPGAYLYWTRGGLGLYLHPKSYPYLGNISSLDMQPDRWIPVTEAAREVPPFVKGT